MRILWFTGVQLPALTGQGLTRAGWQEGLRTALETYQPQVEVGIAAPGSSPRPALTRANAIYFTLPADQPSGRWGRLRRAWKHASYTPMEVSGCLEVVASFKPDLVHFHGSENFFGLISERLEMPSLLSIQAIVNGYFPFFFSDIGWREIAREIASPSFLRGEGPLHKWLTWRKYCVDEKRILEGCRNFIGRTEWDRAVLFAINPTARYFSCNEALSDRFYTCAWNPELSKKGVIYSTSSGNYYKGSLLLARAIVLLKARGWKNIQLRLAGMNPSYDAGKVLVKFIRTHHLEENIVLLERLSPEQITAEMLSAAVYVHPSHIDNSPNSLCEAMLVGLPCIAAHAGGIPSLVRDGEDGLLYHDRDAYMLADRIALLLADRPLATRLGAHARQTALARHDREQIARRMVEIYQQVISGRPN